MGHLSAASLDQACQLLSHRLEDCRDDLENAIDEAKKAALHILIVVLQDAVKHVEELDLILNDRHPPEVQLEEEKESQ